MVRSEAYNLEKVIAQLTGFLEEMGELGKKRPNDAVNDFKLKLLNGALDQALRELGPDGSPLPGFTQFDADLSPSNSDVTMVLTQYLQALDVKRSESIEPSYSGRWVYHISDGGEPIYTAPPVGAKRKY